MVMYYGNSGSPKYVLEEEGCTTLALKCYEGDKETVVARFRRRDFLENIIKESELQRMMLQYTNGKKVYIQKDISYLFAKY